VRETLLLDIPHRQVVFVIPKMLRIFLKYNFLVTEGGVDEAGAEYFS